MSVRLYDTATRTVRTFEPLRPGQVSLYHCGATVQWRRTSAICAEQASSTTSCAVGWSTAGTRCCSPQRHRHRRQDPRRRRPRPGRPWWEWAATHERAFADAYDVLGVPTPVHRTARHRAHPADHRDDRRADRARARLRGRAATSTSRCAPRPDYGFLSGQRLDEMAAGRVRRRRQARPGRLHPVEGARNPASRTGIRRGDRAALAGTSSARRWPGHISATPSTSTAAGWI